LTKGSEQLTRLLPYLPLYGLLSVNAPRRRRDGSRPGSLSAVLERALTREAESLASIAEPIDRVQAANDFYAQLDYELEKVAKVRLEAIRELRATGWSYNRIAEATGLSKERVAQLARIGGVAGQTSQS
jgi:hypothetical protein